MDQEQRRRRGLPADKDADASPPAAPQRGAAPGRDGWHRNGASNDARAEPEPPWERESGRYPVPELPQKGGEPGWEWEPPTVEQSFPGLNLQDLSGTGKIPAMVPLRASDSAWSGGIRAPRGAAPPVAAEEQASVHMRAMRTETLVRATAILTLALLLSRVLGLARTTLLASTFGGSVDELDAFYNALALPEFVFNIVAGGALASAFIPIFTDYLVDKRDRRSAWHVASAALNLSMLALTIVGILGFIFAPQFFALTLHTLYTTKPAEWQMVVDLTRVMLLQPIFLGGGTIAVAILQARNSFVLPAVGQVLYTGGMIFGILLTMLDQRTGIFGGRLGIMGPALGVVLGALLQFAIQIPGLRSAKMQFSLSFDIFHPGVRNMLRLMLPRLLNAAMLYVSIFFTRSLLDMLGIQGATWGYVTAFTLVMLPIGVFGMAISQAAFPTMAALVAAREWPRLRETILRTVRGVIYLGLPSALGMIVLAEPLTRLIVAHGEFRPTQLPLITTPLIFFSVGMLGLSLVEILVRCFYALHDTRTAVQVSILQFMFVMGLSYLLLQPMGAAGLALATSLGANGEALALLLLLRPRLDGLDLRALGVFFLNVLAASMVAALVALLVYTLSLAVLPDGPTSKLQTLLLLGRLALAMLAAAGTYFGLSRFLAIDDVVPLDRLARRLLRR